MLHRIRSSGVIAGHDRRSARRQFRQQHRDSQKELCPLARALNTTKPSHLHGREVARRQLWGSGDPTFSGGGRCQRIWSLCGLSLDGRQGVGRQPHVQFEEL
jgi:hypothetical protein